MSNFTKFPNRVLDELMSQMTPNGWRLFCFVWRKTVGYQKLVDEISYSQIADVTGIKGRSTISAAIADLAKFISIQRNTGRANMCRFDVSELLKSPEIEDIPPTNSQETELFIPVNSPESGLFSQIKSPETEHFGPKNPLKSPVFVVKSPDSGHTKETLTKENTSSDSFQESEVITAHEILGDPKRFTIKQIALVKFTRSQYLQLIEKEKSLGNPRKGLLRHVSDTLTTKPPAVEVYRSVAYTYPERSLWPDIGKTVGENQADLERWRDVVKNYIGLGWNKTNVVNMLDYFRRREIPTMNGNKNGLGDRPTTAKISDNGGAYI